MKKLKLISLILILLSAMGLLTACAFSFNVTYSLSGVKTEIVYTKELSSEASGTVTMHSGDLFCTENDELYKVYNLSSDQYVKETSSNNEVILLTVGNFDYIVIKEKSDGVVSSVSGFNSDGEQISSFTYYTDVQINTKFDIIEISYTKNEVSIYEYLRVKGNGIVEKTFKKGFFSISGSKWVDFDNIKWHSDHYYYALTNSGISAYDQTSGKLITEMHRPTYAIEANFGVLADGGVFMQYVKEASSDDKDYSFYQPNTYTKYTIIFAKKNIETGELAEYTFDYYITAIINDITVKDHFDGKYNTLSEMGISSTVNNIVFGYRISSKRIDFSTENLCYALLDNNYNLTDGSKNIDNQYLNLMPLSNKAFQAIDFKGQSYLVDSYGDVIGRIGNSEDFLYASNSFIVTKTSVTKYSLNDFANYSAEGYEFVKGYADCIIFSKTVDGLTTYYKLDGLSSEGMSLTQIAKQNAEGESSEIEVKDDYYVKKVTNGNNTTYSYYGANGNHIFTRDSEYTLVGAGRNRLLLSYTTSEETVYVIFDK